MSTTPAGGLRKVKRANYLQILNETARDTRISYRALGILTELLSHEEGWVIRAADLGRRRKEGREAIASALRELAAAGYYRVEKRRDSTGKFTMGTAIADYPVPEWIEDFQKHPRGGVPLRVHDDGTVTRMDGTPPEQADSPETGFRGPVDDTDPDTGNGFSESGPTDSGNPPPLEDQSQNTITEGSDALRASTAHPPVETSSSNDQFRNAHASDAAAAAENSIPNPHSDAPRAAKHDPTTILAAMMLNPDEAHRFRTWLINETAARNPDGLIISLHTSGRLSERLSQWRTSENTHPAPEAAQARPGHLEWCGNCDPNTRMEDTTDENGREYLRRCPACNINAGITAPGSGAARAIAEQAQIAAANRTARGKVTFEAARAQLPEGVGRRNTTIGTVIDPKTALLRAESEHTA